MQVLCRIMKTYADAHRHLVHHPRPTVVGLPLRNLPLSEKSRIDRPQEMLFHPNDRIDPEGLPLGFPRGETQLLSFDMLRRTSSRAERTRGRSRTFSEFTFVGRTRDRSGCRPLREFKWAVAGRDRRPSPFCLQHHAPSNPGRLAEMILAPRWLASR